jgi:hypothetical protein
MRRRRGHLGHILAGAAIIAGGIGIGLVEALHLPRGSVWMVLAITISVMVLARSLGNRR